MEGDTVNIGINTYTPRYFTPGRLFSRLDWDWESGASADGIWDNANGTAPVTVDGNGLPQAVSGSRSYTETWSQRSIGTNWPVGAYTVRWKGPGHPSLCDGHNGHPWPISAAGVQDGWNYQTVPVGPATTSGLVLRVAPPVSGLEVLFPGETGRWSKDWAFGPFGSLRFMDAGQTNGSRLTDSGDFKPATFFSDGQRTITRQGTITAAVASTSVFLGGACWLVTHDAPGDPFRTGHRTNLDRIERVSPSQFKVVTATAPSGSVSVKITTAMRWEAMAQTANRFGQDMHLCVPHLLTDEAVRELALRIALALAPGRRCRVEYSNECWNSGTFEQAIYCLMQGRATGLPGTGLAQQLGWYAQRAAQVHGIFARVFAECGRSGDLIRVLGGWAGGGASNARLALSAYQGAYGSLPDEWAIAPYSGSRVDDPAMTPDQVFAMLTTALQTQTVSYLQTHAAAVANTGTALTCYEGGPNLWGSQIATLTAVSRDPRMYALTRAHLDAAKAAGVTVFHWFAGPASITSSGAFGVQEYSGQPLSQTPRLAALLDEIAGVGP